MDGRGALYRPSPRTAYIPSHSSASRSVSWTVRPVPTDRVVWGHVGTNCGSVIDFVGVGRGRRRRRRRPRREPSRRLKPVRQHRCPRARDGAGEPATRSASAVASAAAPGLAGAGPADDASSRPARSLTAAALPTRQQQLAQRGSARPDRGARTCGEVRLADCADRPRAPSSTRISNPLSERGVGDRLCARLDAVLASIPAPTSVASSAPSPHRRHRTRPVQPASARHGGVPGGVAHERPRRGPRRRERGRRRWSGAVLELDDAAAEEPQRSVEHRVARPLHPLARARRGTAHSSAMTRSTIPKDRAVPTPRGLHNGIDDHDVFGPFQRGVEVVAHLGAGGERSTSVQSWFRSRGDICRGPARPHIFRLDLGGELVNVDVIVGQGGPFGWRTVSPVGPPASDDPGPVPARTALRADGGIASFRRGTGRVSRRFGALTIPKGARVNRG